jgi:trans-2,3-dihydro-3-hydroxyanthranilate isomerase
MSRYRFRLVNVFGLAHDAFSGNPLCVFEDGRGLSDAVMQALALQFNLSETTFVLPSEVADARVRIFTPTFEMPFAGHPTLGSAHVLRDLMSSGDGLRLELGSGIVPVSVDGSRYTLQAKSPQTRVPDATRAQLAAALGLGEADISAAPLWVNTGIEQLLVPLTSAAAVDRCAPDARLLTTHVRAADGNVHIYAFAQNATGEVQARYFFNQGAAAIEDPATGSACANLGGFLVATAAPLPLERRVHQGSAIGRPSLLELRVDAEQRIFVTGSVIDVGSGVIELPAH